MKERQVLSKETTSCFKRVTQASIGNRLHKISEYYKNSRNKYNAYIHVYMYNKLTKPSCSQPSLTHPIALGPVDFAFS